MSVLAAPPASPATLALRLSAAPGVPAIEEPGALDDDALLELVAPQRPTVGTILAAIFFGGLGTLAGGFIVTQAPWALAAFLPTVIGVCVVAQQRELSRRAQETGVAPSLLRRIDHAITGASVRVDLAFLRRGVLLPPPEVRGRALLPGVRSRLERRR